MAKTKAMLEEIIKNAEYSFPETISCHGTWFEGNYQFATDGYRAVCLYKPVDVKERESSNLSVTPQFTDAEINCTETIQLPTVKEIRNQITKLIGRKYRSYRVLYRLADDPNLAVVNAKYLVECMESIGATELKYNPLKPKNGLLLMETEIGKVILLPVHNTAEKTGFWKIEI